MPFDGQNLSQDVRNLLTLADALECGLPGFEWDFNKHLEHRGCGSIGCALGLGKIIGLFRVAMSSEARRVFKISERQADSLFLYHEDYGVPRMDDVQPAMVAARLREIAAQKMGAV